MTAFAVALVAFSIEMYRDWAFICENTGSRNGYRQWIFGPKTGHWQKTSPLEEFIQSRKPDALVHRWTSYAGSGKNVFGTPMSRVHGHPGAILHLDHKIQQRWIDKNDTTSVHELYELLVSDDEEQIDKRIRDIWDEVLNYEE